MKTLALCFSCLALLLASGCAATYGHTDIGNVGAGETGGTVSSKLITVPLGTVVTARIASFNTNGDWMSGTVQPEDTSVLEVYETATDRSYAFLGTKVGTTNVALTAQGMVVAIIRAEVVPQP